MESTSFQVVFMVDLNGIIRICDSDQLVQKQLNDIGLSVAKILLQYQTRFSASEGATEDSRRKFQFGYKFYNSLSQSIDRPSFKECSAKNFESFYEELEMRLDDERSKADGSNRKTPAKTGAIKLSNALKELLYDFAWEKNLSPIRQKRKNKSEIISLHHSHQNVVYHFSPCPHSIGDLKEFLFPKDDEKMTNKTPKKGKDVIRNLISQSLQFEMIHTAGIQINWVDVNWLLECHEEQDYPGKGYHLLLDAFTSLGGCILPLPAIIQSSAIDSAVSVMNDDVIYHYKDIANSRNNVQAIIHFPVSRTSYPVSVSKLLKSDDRVLEYQLNMTVLGTTSESCCEWIDGSDLYVIQAGDGFGLCKILFELFQQRRKLVVTVDGSRRHCLLQPLSQNSATMTSIGQHHILDLHRTLLSGENLNGSSEYGLEDFIEKCIGNLWSKEMFGRQNFPGIPEPSAANSASENDMKNFHVSILRPWYRRPTADIQPTAMLAMLKKCNFSTNVALKEEQIAERKLARFYDLEKASSCDSIGSSVPSPADSLISTRRSLDEKGDSARTMTRSRMIIERSRRLHASRSSSSAGISVETLSTKVETKQVSIPATLSDFKTDEELANYLKEQYNQVLLSGKGFHQFAEVALNVVCFFYKSNNSDDVFSRARCLLAENLLLDDAALKQKHCTSKDEAKVQEIQIQIFLQLETENVLSSHVSPVDETLIKRLARLLRTMSLTSKDTTLLPRFLNKEIFEAYCHNLPKTLAELYDELMVPMPDSMPPLFSPALTPGFSDDGSKSSNQPSLGNASVLSTELFSEESNPHSNRPRRGRFMNKDMGQYSRRIIALPQRRDVKHLEESKLTRSMSFSGSNLRQCEEAVRQKAVRNLVGAFVTGQSSSAQPTTRTTSRIDRGQGDASSLPNHSRLIGRGMRGTRQERRQSVAVIEKILKTPPQPKKVLKTNTVRDTPTRKRRLRSVENSAVDEVVFESPPKSPTGENGKRKHSFYDPSKKSRNIQKYKEQDVQPIKFKSPTRGQVSGNSGFLFSQLTSPNCESSTVLRRTPSRNTSSTVRQSPRIPRTPRALDLLSPKSSGRRVKRKLLSEEYTESPRKAVKVGAEDSPGRFERTPVKTVSESPLVSRLRYTPKSILKSPLARGSRTPGEETTPSRRSAMRAVKFDDTPSKSDVSQVQNSPGKYCLRMSSAGISPTKRLETPRVSLIAVKNSPPNKLSLVHSSPKKVASVSPLRIKYNLRKTSSPEQSGSTTPPKCTPSPTKARTPNKSPKRLSPVHRGYDVRRTPTKSSANSTTSTPRGCKNSVETYNTTPRTKALFRTFSSDWGTSPPPKEVNVGALIDRLEPSTGEVSELTPLKPKSNVLTSPDSKVIVTPESFDKWKRVKRHGPNSLSKSPLLDSSSQKSELSTQNENKSPLILRVKRKVMRSSCLSPKRQQIRVKDPGTPDSMDSIVLISPLKQSEYERFVLKTEEKTEVRRLNAEFSAITCAQAGLEVVSPIATRGLTKTELHLKESSPDNAERTRTPDSIEDRRVTRNQSSADKRLREDILRHNSDRSPPARRSLGSLGNTIPNSNTSAEKEKTKLKPDKPRKVKSSVEKLTKLGLFDEVSPPRTTRSGDTSNVELSDNSASLDRVTHRAISPSIGQRAPSRGVTVRTSKHSSLSKPWMDGSPSNSNESPKSASMTSVSGQQKTNASTPKTASSESSPVMSLTGIDDLDKSDRSEMVVMPLRFTRGLSREVGIAPDVYRQMSTRSPCKEPTEPPSSGKRSLVSSPEEAGTPKRRKSEKNTSSELNDQEVFASVTFSPALEKLKERSSLDNSPVSGRKFSPIMSVKGLTTLLSSPILPVEMNETDDRLHEEKRSRRSLYK